MWNYASSPSAVVAEVMGTSGAQGADQLVLPINDDGVYQEILPQTHKVDYRSGHLMLTSDLHMDMNPCAPPDPSHIRTKEAKIHHIHLCERYTEAESHNGSWFLLSLWRCNSPTTTVWAPHGCCFAFTSVNTLASTAK